MTQHRHCSQERDRGRSAPAPGPGNIPTDGGFVALEWVLALTVLLVPTLLVVLALPGWAMRHEAAGAAAREAARSAAVATTVGQARARAEAAAAGVLADRGLTEVAPRVELSVSPAPAEPTAVLPREGSVAVTVILPTRPVVLPVVGTVQGPSVHGRHTRLLDPLRSR